jgi:hypothetical protein
VGDHLRAELGQSLLVVLLSGLVFDLAALPTPMLPALAAGLLRLVPFFGAGVATVVAYLAGAAVGPAVGALAAAYTLLLLLLVGWGARHLAGCRPASPTLAVFLSVALADAYGIAGLAAASTLAAAAQALVGGLIVTQARPARRARSLAEIERRLARVRQRLAHMPSDEAAQLGSVVSRLSALAVRARGVTGDAASE